MDEDFPYGQLPPPAVSLGPDSMPQQPSQAVQPAGGIPAIPMSDPIATPGTPEYRAQAWIDNNPDYKKAHDYQKQVDDNLVKHNKFRDDLIDYANNSINQDDENDGTTPLQAAAAIFGHGHGLISRSLSFAANQQKQNQMNARQARGQRLQLMRIAEDAYEKGDTALAEQLGHALKLGSDTADMVKMYSANDAREERLKNASEKLTLQQQNQKIYAQNSESLRQQRQFMQRLMSAKSPADIARLQAEARNYNARADMMGEQLPYAGAMEQAKLDSLQQGMGTRYDNANSARAATVPGFQPPPMVSRPPMQRRPLTLTKMDVPPPPPGTTPDGAILGNGSPVAVPQGAPTKADIAKGRADTVNDLDRERANQMRIKNAELARTERGDAEYEARQKNMSVDELVRQHPEDYPTLAGRTKRMPPREEMLEAIRKKQRGE